MSIASSDTVTDVDVRDEVAGVLGVDADSLSPTDDLVMHGLDSLRIMRLAGQWRKRGHDIDFARMAAEPTLQAWSALLGAATSEAADVDGDALRYGSRAGAAEPATTRGRGAAARDLDTQEPDVAFPLAPMQHAYWVGRSDSHALGGVAAHLYVEFDCDDALDPERFRTAVTALAERHPMLRARIGADGTQTIGALHRTVAPCTTCATRMTPPPNWNVAVTRARTGSCRWTRAACSVPS